ncbi:ecdysteroid phosphate phosphatase isoform X1 [Musca autumnalis]|uniref:ecdysteroid phosphate phosphatase isoform X1 n=1 Tax=Musca autumnalis TaxID=221902 RepID=UPI003CF7FD5F
MSGSLQVEKLNGDNYSSWAVHMKSLLITMDYWSVVEEMCPVAGTSEEKASWKALDMKALATITLSIKPSELIHIKKCKSAKDAWNTLSNIYVGKNPARKVTLFKRLVRFRIQDGISFAQQLNEFCNLVDSLREIDIKIPEDFVSIVLLCSLPEEYESFRIAMESRDVLPPIDTLKVKILEESHRREEKPHMDEEHVFAANYKNKAYHKNRKGNNTKESDENRRNNIKCYACGKRGHIRSQCKKYNNNAAVMSAGDFNFCSAENMWIVDSGASSHMSGDKTLFSSLKEHKQKITLASGDCMYAEGIGDVHVKSEFTDITLTNVLFVPKLSANFISVYKMIEHGNKVNFSKEKVIATTTLGGILFKAVANAGMFLVELVRMERLMMAKKNDDSVLWHKRYGHLNANDMQKLLNGGLVRGMFFEAKDIENLSCTTCSMCKITSQPFTSYGNSFSKHPLELVHTDICGPMRVRSEGGSRYFISFIDDFSRFITVYFLKRKSDALQVFKRYKSNVEKQTGYVLKTLRSDNGTEYLNNDFQMFLKSEGINHQTTVVYTPQQNGIAERANRTLMEMARCLLLDSGLPQSIWSEALNTSVYIRNRCPTKVLQNKTPYECWYGRKPSVAHLRTFGCDVVALNKRKGKSKLLPKGEQLTFVGYAHQTKGYRLYNRNLKTITIARDVKFFENSFSNFGIGDDGESESNDDWFVVDIGADKEQNKNVNTADPVIEDDMETSVDESDDGESGQKRKRGRPKVNRTGRRGRPRKLRVVEAASNALLNYAYFDEEDPKSIAEAMQSKNAERWKEAMHAEYDCLQKKKTWKLVEKPTNRNIVGCKWVFVTKRNQNGEVEKYKARLVAQGFSQKPQIDYTETYSPVIRMSAVRMLFAVAAQKGYLLNHIDIVSAYLNGELEEEVFMRQPQMFVDTNYPDRVCKLNKSLYGLKQAGRDWNKKLNDVLVNIGFERCKSDNCLYVKNKDQDLVLVAVYVDDLLLCCSSEEIMKGVVRELNKYVDAVDRGPAKYYLGIQIERDGLRGKISIHQEKYVNELLEKWQMTECKPTSTPSMNGMVLEKCSKENCCGYDVNKYQSLIGALNYLSVYSRPDITHIVSKLAQFNSHPEKEHFIAAKHVLRYLKGKPKGTLTYDKNNNGLVLYTDADWGSDVSDRKSYSGFVIFMSGGPVAWESQNQSFVSLSSMEAEYVAMCQGTKEIVYQRSLLREIGLEEYVRVATVLNCDNQSAQFLVQNPVAHKRSKHIDIRYHYIREKFDNKEITIQYVASEENVADLFTKCLSKVKHNKFCNMLFEIF